MPGWMTDWLAGIYRVVVNVQMIPHRKVLQHFRIVLRILNVNPKMFPFTCVIGPIDYVVVLDHERL